MNIRTGRVEAFSDGVIAIIITIMVFDIKFPVVSHVTRSLVIRDLQLLAPRLIAYLFSFLLVGIMWLNHHHLFHLIQVVDEKILWLNLHFLFWMSLIPFPTSMIGANPLLPDSSAVYGTVLSMCALSFTLMRSYAIRKKLMHQDDNRLNKEVYKVSRRARIKNIIATLAYLVSIPVAYLSVYLSFVCFMIPPVLFFIPDGVPGAGEEHPAAIVDPMLNDKAEVSDEDPEKR